MGRTATYPGAYAADAAAEQRLVPRGVVGGGVAAGRPAAGRDVVPPADRVSHRLGRRACDFWLRALFAASERYPAALRSLRELFSRAAYAASGHVRRATLANAARILGPASSAADRRRLALGVIRNFYLFALDVGRSTNLSRDQLLAEIGTVAGEPHFDAAQAAGRGLIVVTAHMGSFEVGLAQMTTRERRLNVIFRRDAQGGFERQRSGLRDRLGVRENPADDGLPMWVRLRDALAAGEVVIFQGDRVMPGQRGRRVPFLHGHLDLPTGPAKLARISGAPILPVFTARDPATGKVNLFIESAITAADADAGDDLDAVPSGRGIDPMLGRFAAVLERYVRAFPDQWLMFHPAFCEDQPAAPAGPTASAPAVDPTLATKDAPRA